MPPFEATITLASDGSLHMKVSQRGFMAVGRFSPAKALAIKEFLTSPDTEWERDPNGVTHETIRFNHETGKITLFGLGYEKDFDPDKEESMIRLVRHLMNRAPMPVTSGQQPLPGVLPAVTEEDLKKRTVLAEVGSAGGIKSYKKPKPRYNPPTASQLRSQELVAQSLSFLLVKGIR